MTTKWLKLSKGLFLFNGITTILIGLTHTYAHYAELVSDDIKRTLDKEIVVMGTESNIWDLWQGMSLMMGILLVIVGLIMKLFWSCSSLWWYFWYHCSIGKYFIFKIG